MSISKKKILVFIHIILNISVVVCFCLSLSGKVKVPFAVGLFFLSEFLETYIKKYNGIKFVPVCQIVGSIILMVSAFALQNAPTAYQIAVYVIAFILILIFIIHHMWVVTGEEETKSSKTRRNNS